MEQKKTLSELYQDCKRKQELKEFMARLKKDFSNVADGYFLSTFDEIVELYLNKCHFR